METRSMSRKRLKLEQEEREREVSRRKSVQVFCDFDVFNYNPMMNDVILKHLFEVVDHQELATFRQVCKHWYNVSLASWLKNGPSIVLEDDEDSSDFVDVIDTGRGRRGRKYAEISGIQRYQKFSLKGYVHDIQTHNLFRDMYGPWLTHFSVINNAIPGAIRLLNILTCKFTPKLEFLEVDVGRYYYSIGNNEEEDEIRQLPMYIVEAENKNLKEFRLDYQDEMSQLSVGWKTLLSHYPKLEHFSVGYYLSSGTRRRSQMEPILNAIKEIRKDDKDKLNLKSLNWFYNMSDTERCYAPIYWDPLSPSFPRLYREFKLRIETFRIAFCDDDSDQVINNILSTFGSSLRKLDFYRLSVTQHLTFRSMDQLHVLTLRGYPVANLLFLTELRNLRSLNLTGYLNTRAAYADSIISATNVPHLTFPSMTQFYCNYEVNWTDADVNLLHELMPNLIQVEMQLCNPAFRLVCQHWPRLEHLSVYGGKIGDHAIVGLDKDGPEVVYNQPNITNLTELKSFTMDYMGLYGTSLSKEDFSEHSLLTGFCRLRQLQQLVIRNIRIDPDVGELIKRNIPFAKVVRRCR